MIKQYCIYTRDFKQTPGLFSRITEHNIPFEAHINRTRFWLDTRKSQHQKFYIQYRNYMHCVDHETDHCSGT